MATETANLAVVRTIPPGRRLDSPALIADGAHGD